MQLIIGDVTYDGSDADVKRFLEGLLRHVAIVSQDVSIQEVDIGRGASWPVLLLTIGGLFFLGKPINENLEAWISMAGRFKSLLRSLRRKKLPLRIDKEGAALLAVKAIMDMEARRGSGKLTSIRELSDLSFPVSPISWQDSHSLAGTPDALYLQVYEVNRQVIYICGVKSSGRIDFMYRLDLSDWAGFE